MGELVTLSPPISLVPIVAFEGWVFLNTPIKRIGDTEFWLRNWARTDQITDEAVLKWIIQTRKEMGIGQPSFYQNPKSFELGLLLYSADQIVDFVLPIDNDLLRATQYRASEWQPIFAEERNLHIRFEAPYLVMSDFGTEDEAAEINIQYALLPHELESAVEIANKEAQRFIFLINTAASA